MSDSTYVPLNGATFTVYYADKQTVVKVTTTSTDGFGNVTTSTEKLENLTSGASGVFWVGELPYGTYYLEETQAPTGYSKPSKYFVLTVSADGVTQLEATKATGSTQKLNELKESVRSEDVIPQKTDDTNKLNTASTPKTSLSAPGNKTMSPLKNGNLTMPLASVSSANGQMWGSITGDVEMEPSEKTYSFEAAGEKLEGKTAYVWPEESWEDLGYDQNSDQFSVSAGTLIRYDGKFRLLTEDFEAGVNQLGSVESHSIELGEEPTVLTEADFTGNDSTTYPENVDVSKETVFYTDGTDYWILVKDGSPGKPETDPDRWIRITEVLDLSEDV